MTDLLGFKNVDSFRATPIESGEKFLKKIDSKSKQGYSIILSVNSWIISGDEVRNGGHAVTYLGIDAFYQGVATSVKTMNIFAKKYVTKGGVAKQLTKYVDDLANFNGRTWGGQTVEGSEITKKVLEVGIPKGASEKIIEQITKVTEYAKTKGVELNVRVVK